MIRVSCKCGFRGQVSPSYAGKQVKCRQCAGTIAVPAEGPVPIEIESEPTAPSSPSAFAGIDNARPVISTSRLPTPPGPSFPWWQLALGLVTVTMFAVGRLFKGTDPGIMLPIYAGTCVFLIAVACIGHWLRQSNGGKKALTALSVLGLLLLLGVMGIGLVNHLKSGSSASDNKGVEGTKWSHRGGTYHGIDVAPGAMTLEFGKDGSVQCEGPTGRLSGTYELGSGNCVTFHLHEEVSGKKDHQLKIFVQGDELTMDDWDGTRHVFARVLPQIAAAPSTKPGPALTEPAPVQPKEPRRKPTARTPEPTPDPVKEPVVPKPPEPKPPEPKPPEPKPPEAKPRPVPNEAELAAAEKLIKELFKDDYARTKPADRLALSQKLLGQARDTKDDAAARYVLFRESVDLAAQAGDPQQACETIGELAKAFAVNSGAMRAAVFEKAAAAIAPAEAAALVDKSLPIIHEAVANDDYEGAGRMAKAAETAAQKSRNAALVTHVRGLGRDIDKFKDSFEKAQPALMALQNKPDDTEANLVVGRHYCFVKGAWDKGLPFLIKGGDEALKALALKERDLPAKPAEQLALADAWYEVAAKESLKGQILLRAHHWYKEALPGLAGLTKTKAEKRLAELDKLVTPPGDGARIFADIRKQIADKNLKRWGFVGGAFAKDPFEEVPVEGAILVGLRYATGADSKPSMVQPIWQTARGIVNGKAYGAPEAGTKITETRAKPGYAVGTIYVRGGAYIAGFKPIYMKITDKGLDVKDSYDGPHVGITKGGGEGFLGGDGHFIVGLYGKLTDKKLGTLSPISLTTPLKDK